MKFDIQRFDDTITAETELGIKFNFGTEDNRTVTVPNARDDIEASEVTELETWVVNNNALLGDKELAPVTEIESATLTTTERIKLDISATGA